MRRNRIYPTGRSRTAVSCKLCTAEIDSAWSKTGLLLCNSILTDRRIMSIDRESSVHQYTCCPGGKRTSAIETVLIKGMERTIEHSWRPHPRGVQVTSTLIKKNGQKGQVKMAVVPNELEAVTDVCRAHIEVISKACKWVPLPPQPKRETQAIVRERREARNAAMRGRDRVGRSEVRANPISEAISSSSRRRGERASLQQPQEETPRVGGKMHVNELRHALDTDPDLLDELGLTQKEEAEVHKANSRELAASLALISSNGQGKTEIGRIAKQTVMACFAGTGEHSSHVSLEAFAESIGVRRDALAEAQRRMQAARHDVLPASALESGEYIWTKRRKRNDATCDEILALANRYWHCIDVSRTIDNSDDQDMWRPSKAEDAPVHPRRQLVVEGGEDVLYRGFLTWAPYLAYKAEQDDSFKDPGRTTFLQTRCPCLVLPKMEQCACEIHTQQNQYLGALAHLWGTIHTDCSWECAWCKGGCGKWSEMTRNLGNFSEFLACPKLNLFQDDPESGEMMARTPACVNSKCNKCGFGKPDGIPECIALKAFASHQVGWIRFQDQTREEDTTNTAKRQKRQQLPVVGSLGELWEEFQQHTRKYLVHHSIAK